MTFRIFNIRTLPIFSLMALLSASAFGQQLLSTNNIPATSLHKITSSTLSHLSDSASSSRLHAYVSVTSSTELDRLTQQYGVKFNVNQGTLYTAIIPTSTWTAFLADTAVVNVDTGNRIRLMNDSIRLVTHVDQIQSGWTGFTGCQGEGVLIGVIDYGFDFTHPAFSDADGQCRIQCVWDQNNPQSNNPTYGYGSIYTSPDQIAAMRHDYSSDTHGTHVLGIAAGSGHPLYQGIAPQSQLAIVSTNQSEQGIIDGVDFLLKYAESVQKPIAINVSLGTVLGYKDGTSSFSMMLDSLLAKRKGQLLAIATGNEGHRNSVIQGSTPATTLLQIPDYGRENIFFQGEAKHIYRLSLTLQDTINQQVLLNEEWIAGESETFSREGFGTDDKDYARLYVSSQINPRTGAPSSTCNLTYRKRPSEAWTISVTETSGRYYLGCDYGTFTSNGHANYCEGSNIGTLATTATGMQPIAVGAWVSRHTYKDLSGTSHNQPWKRGGLYPLSGKGPTFDGRIKPDITAPGAAVISAYNSFAAPYAVPASQKVDSQIHQERKYYWGVQNGTSMATPVVTGIMALWLQCFPDLTADEVKEALQKTAVRDTQTGLYPNGNFGYGKIDAYAGLKYLLDQRQVGISSVSAEHLPWFYQTDTRTLYLLQDAPVQVYSIDGRLVLQKRDKTINLQSLPAGAYIIAVQDQTQKILIP